MAWYNSGTITLTNGSKVVTGIGTGWNNKNVVSGFALQPVVEGEFELLEIDEASNQGTMLLRDEYAGTTKENIPYKIVAMFGATPAVTALNDLTETFKTYADTPAFDLTPGRVRRVGDFGDELGAASLNSESDLDLVVTPGYRHWSNTENTPTNFKNGMTGAWLLEVRVISATLIKQTAWKISNNGNSLLILTRARAVGSWSDWVPIYTSANLVGDAENGVALFGKTHVSGNGNWWHLTASGHLTMRVRCTIDLTTGNTQTFTFPAGFPTFSGAPGGHSVYVCQEHVQDVTPDALIAFKNIENARATNTGIAINLENTTEANPAADTRRLVATVTGLLW